MNKNVFACLLAMATVGYAPAQDQISAGGRPLRMQQIPPQKLGLNHVDSKALKDMAIANMMEIKTSELALDRGSSEWVRQYAKEMIQEHTMAQNEVKMMAREKGVALPQTLPADKRALLGKLQSARGSRFDTLYRQIQLMAHQETEHKLRKAMAGGRDADVRELEVKLLPGVVMHRRLAVMRQTMMGATKHEGNRA